MPPKKKDYAAFFAALAQQRDLPASPAIGLTGSPPAAQPAAPVAAPAPPDSAGRADALSRLKLRAKEKEDAGLLHTWVDAAFCESPEGALAVFFERVEEGIAEGRYKIEDVLQWIKDPANEQGIQTMLSMSLPGQRVFAHQLESWNSAAVIENYLNGLYASAQGEVSRLPKLLADLSLGGNEAPPARAQVRRA